MSFFFNSIFILVHYIIFKNPSYWVLLIMPVKIRYARATTVLSFWYPAKIISANFTSFLPFRCFYDNLVTNEANLFRKTAFNSILNNTSDVPSFLSYFEYLVFCLHKINTQKELFFFFAFVEINLSFCFTIVTIYFILLLYYFLHLSERLYFGKFGVKTLNTVAITL